MKIRQYLAVIVLLGTALCTHAASLSLLYAGDNALDQDGAVIATTGDVLLFELRMDFSGTQIVGSVPRLETTIGGGYDIAFDEDGFSDVEFTSAELGVPNLYAVPELLPGLLEGGAFGDFNGLSGPATVGWISFTVIGSEGDFDITPLERPTLDQGFFISAITFIDILDVDYNGVTVRVVPLPAAVWFMLSGLIALFWQGRRCR